jgi:hypothetical protein
MTFEPVADDLNYLITFGTEGDAYWDTWDYLLNNMSIVDKNTSKTFFLHQDEDLWLVPSDYDWSAEEN